MVGWGVTLFLIARYAFTERRPELLRILLYGLLAWAPVDMAVSIFYGAWFNVALNLVIISAAGTLLILTERRLRQKPNIS
jgi:vacuolar-type H+-ATPase subunit I/STV1